MPDILHKVGIKSSSPDNVYKALTTVEGLSGWWTSDTRGDSKVGGVLQFRFGDGGFDMKVVELQPGSRVLWQVVDGPEEWLGTKVTFDIKQNGDWTIVLFKHQDWKEPVEFMHHCSTKWAVFLLSLKSLMETGKGRALAERDQARRLGVIRTPPKERTMTSMTRDEIRAPKVVDRSTFQTDLDALRVREKAHMRAGDAIAAARRRLPMVEVNAATPLVGDRGAVTLLDVFEGRRQLIAYYFMWDAGSPAPGQCEGCSFYTSQVRELSFIHSRDVTYATFCQGPHPESARYRDFMGGRCPGTRRRGSRSRPC